MHLFLQIPDIHRHMLSEVWQKYKCRLLLLLQVDICTVKHGNSSNDQITVSAAIVAFQQWDASLRPRW